jgi:hypothetical protein
MLRKSIESLNEMPDSIFFKKGVTIEELQRNFRAAGSRRARILCEMASLTKRMINEGVAFEELLSEKGLLNVSAAVYALEWAELYYKAEDRRRELQKRGYWKNLWLALLGRL